MAIMKRIQLGLDAQLAEALRKRHVETGCATQEFIRRAVRMALYQENQHRTNQNTQPEMFQEK